MADPAWIIAEAVRRGRRRAVDGVEGCLAEIEAQDNLLHAFVHVDPDGALAAAEAVDVDVRSGRDPGPFAGVPIGVKDLEDVRGMPTRRGSLAFADSPPAGADSAHIAILRAAGAIPIGKTATPELGLGLTCGTTVNPWDRRRSPGGSSGGSAAAVAAGLVPLAVGSDAGGSVRVPASFCGLIGFKPTTGSIPSAAPTRHQLSSAGVLATTTVDAARYLDVVLGLDPTGHGVRATQAGPSHSRQARTLPTRGLRATWWAELGGAPVDREVARVTRAAAETLMGVAGLAARPDPPDLVGLGLGLEAWAVLMATESRHDDLPVARLTPAVRELFDRARRLGPDDVAAAEQERDRLRAVLARLFQATDVLITPTAAVPALSATAPFVPIVGGRDASMTGPAPFGPLANLGGCPAISVPAGHVAGGFGPNGPTALPVGLQLIGPPGSDGLLLRLAGLIEGARPWPRVAPSAASPVLAT